jgi:hypothetical protein
VAEVGGIGKTVRWAGSVADTIVTVPSLTAGVVFPWRNLRSPESRAGWTFEGSWEWDDLGESSL